MKASELPRVGVILNPMDGDRFGHWSDLEGKNLLCLGMSESQIDKFIAPHAPGGVTLLTYWADHVDAHSASYPLTIGDITTRTDFVDDEFDAVLTMSVLEHVSKPEAAFAEMARVIRPGGEMLHIFGPAWSSAYGHHLCTGHDDPMLNFYRWQMPAHMHLLCSEREVADFYDELGLGRDMGQSVFDEFHRNDHINRRVYEDYVTIMHDYQVVRSEIMYNVISADHARVLRESMPGVRDFSTYGGCYKLVVH